VRAFSFWGFCGGYQKALFKALINLAEIYHQTQAREAWMKQMVTLGD
jgi:hypothetical protein